MVRWITLLCALLLGAFQAQAAQTSAAPLPERVLLVVSSHGRDAGKTQPGFEMDELSQAWLVLRANGFAVDIASPAGGPVVADEHDPGKPYNAAFAADAEAQRKLAATLPLSPAMAGQYSAIMVIGGKGAMFDLPFSQVLQSLLKQTEARGGVVAAVCHGPAVFARIRNADGSAWIQGRRLTGFTDEEEALFGKTWVPHFPFLLESELRRLGAEVTEAPIMLPHVAIDGRVVTGQNPFSVAAAADAVVAALGRTPLARNLWPDERSLALVALTVAGDTAPLAAALEQGSADIDAPLVAIWGYYRALQAGDDPAMLAPALKVMELARPHFPEPQLDAAMAEARAVLARQQRP
ncbi:type 1 glutamine amidotransferase domain-containing protein [Erythrobacter sp. sf7]|uniref:Type 1 glutamine amidotransferase domain-containing protein n=1 Tax=Erythrobacter fulvus TaxID=2987523 RepID=A0ABT5JT97_9SPHN|nr:type 1 glutamine amidotransferase domain-containing protein [Erythrobacter fulvus]MDC8755380.1 type 1 glutamine amidotransferase domain-containing protein [Erythrobacter fulvus]